METLLTVSAVESLPLTFPAAQDSVRSLAQLFALDVAHVAGPLELAQLPEPAVLADAASARTVAVTWRRTAGGRNTERGRKRVAQPEKRKNNNDNNDNREGLHRRSER